MFQREATMYQSELILRHWIKRWLTSSPDSSQRGHMFACPAMVKLSQPSLSLTGVLLDRSIHMNVLILEGMWTPHIAFQTGIIGEPNDSSFLKNMHEKTSNGDGIPTTLSLVASSRLTLLRRFMNSSHKSVSQSKTCLLRVTSQSHSPWSHCPKLATRPSLAIAKAKLHGKMDLRDPLPI